MTVHLELPARGVLRANDVNDPLPYYYHPWVGWLYRHRLQMGLDLLPPGGHAGARGRRRQRRPGADADQALSPSTPGPTSRWRPGLDALVAPGCGARFRAADLLRDGDLPADHFDAIVCFSVLEHIRDADGAARGLARALAPGGTLVTGYPMVSPLMTRAFDLIGFRGIDDHHVSPPARIAAALGRVLRPVARVAFPPLAPVAVALYQCSAWTKPA